ncbi:MAG: hypothetical protein AAFP67_13355 [Pseudomonadota bacterium]
MTVIDLDARRRRPLQNDSKKSERLTARHRIAGCAADLHTVLFEPLPDDVVEHEVTMAILFRSSRMLNVALGGEAGMTFSARCHMARTRRRHGVARTLWAATETAIDLGCFILRGERGHCAMAFYNHRARLNGDPVGDAAYDRVMPVGLRA